MARTNPTVVEVSRLAGCSIATVSRVLNNSGPVSQKTREAVLRVVREAQHAMVRPGAGVKGKAAEAGVVQIIQHRHSPMEQVSVDGGSLEIAPPASPEAVRPLAAHSRLSNSFHRHIIDGSIEELSRWGYRAHLQMNTNLMEPGLLAGLNSPDCSGVMLIGEYSSDLAAFVSQCVRPLVLVDFIHQGPVDVITTDNFAGIGLAFRHLFEQGHRRIGFIGRMRQVTAFEERFTAFRLNMVDAGLTIRPEWVYEGQDQIELTSTGVRRILMQEQRPTALICANDVYAVGVMRAASNLGISIPRQLSVVGFDDVDYAALVTPPLTTVQVPLHEMGRRAVQQLMLSIQSGGLPGQCGCQVRLMPSLVVRGSAGAVPAGDGGEPSVTGPGGSM